MRGIAFASIAAGRTDIALKGRMKKRQSSYYLAAAVSLITLAVYLWALRNDFVLWDDDGYVVNKIQIRSLNIAFLKWAFTDLSNGFWHPLTWISYAVDYALWGLNPLGFHLTAILLHAANTFLVVLLIKKLLEIGREVAWPAPSGKEGANRIAAGAAGILFGIHPLHVESVAWIAERKDLLCAFFFLLSITTYVNYARAEGVGAVRNARPFYLNRRYLLSLLFFAAALASKTMAVSLPAVLLLLDWYPFKRILSHRDARQVLIEKIPFIGCSLLISIVSIIAQKAVGGLSFMDAVPLPTRLIMAFRALVTYLWKMAAPLDLLPLYPYPGDVSLLTLKYLLPIVLVCGMTAACISVARKNQVWLAAWLYYVITLLPVLGIVQVGYFPMADRFTYLPSLGPFLIAGLGAAWAWEKAVTSMGQSLPAGRLIAIPAIVLCIALVYGTIRQISIWENSVTLWNYVIAKEPGTLPAAYHNRGLAFKALGRLDRAMEDFSAAITLERGTAANTFNSRGLAFQEQGRFDRAIEDFSTAITLDPQFADAYTNRGLAFKELGRFDRAMEDYNKAIELAPTRYIVYNNRGMVFQAMGQPGPAIEDFTRSITLNPYFAQAYTNRGLAFEQAGQVDLALNDYSMAIEVDSAFANAYNNRGLIFERTGRPDLALEDFNAAIRLNPSGVEAYINRGLVFEDLAQFDRAVEDYGRAIELKPDDYLAYSNRGIALAKMGRVEEAVEDQTQAISLKPDFARAYLDRGDCYRALGRPALAARDYGKACDMGSETGCAALQKGS